MEMNLKLPSFFTLSAEILRARSYDLPVVALESTVITHGLPYPENFQLARSMESEVRGQGAVPATVAVIDGSVCVGINEVQMEKLAQGKGVCKISSRDFGAAVARHQTGGTTVAGTMAAAHPAGIKVFATGGIGGVHRSAPGSVHNSAQDVSADLTQLARLPMVVVCAGAKAILDLPGTLEMLETLGVPVVGYQTDEFPAFYSRSSGLAVTARADSPEEVAAIARAHWEMGMQSAVLVTAPPPEDVALPNDEVEAAVSEALQAIEDSLHQPEKQIRGQAVTPFLLRRVAELTAGRSLQANLGLLTNNARVAGLIARHLHKGFRQMNV